MKIGILGTRGIPNQYGGYEQFTAYAAPELVKRGHEVYVYNSSLHPYQSPEWKGVKLIKCSDPENKMGTAGQFLYDLNCILDARKRNYDIILQLGYTSSSIWSFLFPSRSIIVTNMDGLEWKRSKYSKPVQQFLKKAEKWAAIKSDHLIADSIGIQQYLRSKYGKESAFIAYGADIIGNIDEKYLSKWNLKKFYYNVLIARMEPENNIETIIKGHLLAKQQMPLLIIGNYKNKFGSRLFSQYNGHDIRFIGPEYDIDILNNIRYHSFFYFHGHSVGGTNPSLLEAMASHSLIVAHDNVFNRSVLQNDAFYFNGPGDIGRVLDSVSNKESHAQMLRNNLQKISNEYSWDHIIDLLERFLTHVKTAE